MVALTPRQHEILAAIAGDERPVIPPMMRWALLRARIIRPVDPPRPPRQTPGRQRAPKPRRYAVTDLGLQAIAAHGGTTCEH